MHWKTFYIFAAKHFSFLVFLLQQRLCFHLNWSIGDTGPNDVLERNIVYITWREQTFYCIILQYYTGAHNTHDRIILLHPIVLINKSTQGNDLRLNKNSTCLNKQCHSSGHMRISTVLTNHEQRISFIYCFNAIFIYFNVATLCS